MTTEDDFQAALDANPADWQTRLVFADWLQERNDPRAEGYRALGANRIVPIAGIPGQSNRVAGWSLWGGGTGWRAGVSPPHNMPEDWRTLLPSGHYDGGHVSEAGFWEPTRRETEDEAARVFAKLPPKRRAELLAGV